MRLMFLSLLCLVSTTANARSIDPARSKALLHHARLAPQQVRLPRGAVEQRQTDQSGGDKGHEHAAVAADAPACEGLRGRTVAISTDKPVHLGLKTYPTTLDLHDHEVVLTFDDGPSPATTPAVLEALRHECVKATFFLIGRNAAANPALVRKEIAEGQTLGHHSMTHPSVTLRGLDEHSGEANINEGFAADETAAYGDVAAGAPRVPFFRFPGFADTKHLLDVLDGRHIAVFGADLWAADWLPMTPDVERKRLLDRLERSPHHAGIILLHDTKQSTAKMLPAFLRDLRARNYKVVDVVPAGQGGEPAQIREAPKGWTSETEAIIAHVWPTIAPGAHHRFSGRKVKAVRVVGASPSRRRSHTAARSGSRRT